MTNSSVTRREVVGGMAAALVTSGATLAAARSQPLNFLVVGDWGRDGSDHQRDVAKQMGLAAEALRCQFIVSVGDNFYSRGVQSPTDPQWLSSFENVYTARALQVPWYVTLGNHDYRGSPQAQVDYSRTSRRWRMPARYYAVPGASLNAPFVDMFFIDTSPLVHEYRQEVEDAIAANVASQDVPRQLRWLDEQLGRSTATWKLVFGHQTLHSGGSEHGDTPEMVALVEPLLKAHGVQAYFNGHDHDLQHVQRAGLSCVGSGAGSRVRAVSAVAGTKFCAAVSGFAAVSVTEDKASLQFRDFAGANLYHGELARGPVKTKTV